MRLVTMLAFVAGSTGVCIQIHGQETTVPVSRNGIDGVEVSAREPGLTNKDALAMQAAGLAPEVVTAKINSSNCNFDTTTTGLVELKGVSVSDSVLLAILNCSSKNGHEVVPNGHDLSPNAAANALAPKGYTLSYVQSDRRWRFGLRSEPFNKVSEYFERQLNEAFTQKGLRPLPAVEDGCCKVVVELLEVIAHPAMFKKPGMDVSATVTVTDSSGRLLFSKGYRGESRTMLNTYGHMINHAIEDMVANISTDESIIYTLATGQKN